MFKKAYSFDFFLLPGSCENFIVWDPSIPTWVLNSVDQFLKSFVKNNSIDFKDFHYSKIKEISNKYILHHYLGQLLYWIMRRYRWYLRLSLISTNLQNLGLTTN